MPILAIAPKPLLFPSLAAPNRLSFLPTPTPATKKITTLIRMGGGPRTFPGGVSKWQWKRMQAKKAKQLLKARLCRERQIYEMRKRAELRAAVCELERPWEAVAKAPTLFSVGADEQVKVLADRFQRPGGFDMWTAKDGPQLFDTVDELPSARFFPKGVVHSVRPYKISSISDDSVQTDLHLITEDSHSNARKEGKIQNRRIESSKRGMDSGQIGLGDDFVETNLANSDHLIAVDSHSNARKEPKIQNWDKGSSIESSKRGMNSGRIGLDDSVETNLDDSDQDSHLSARKEGRIRNRSIESSKRGMSSGQIGLDGRRRVANSHPNARKGKIYDGKIRNRSIESSKRGMNSGQIGLDGRQRVADSHVHNDNRQYGRGKDSRRIEGLHSEVYDMSLEQDGSYKFQPE